MALGKTITIEIIDNNIDREESTPAQEEQKKEPGAKKKSTKKEKSSVSVIGMYAFNNVKNELVSTVTSTLNRQITLNENYLAQNNLNIAKKSVSLVSGLASSVYIGGKVGVIGGPVGMTIGAAVGAATWGMSQYISYQNRMSSYYQQLNSNNFNTEFSQVRAGLINNGRGTEN